MASLEDEQSFAQIWEEAEMRFQQATDKSLKQPKKRSLDDVMKELDNRFNSNDSEERYKQQRFKQAALNVLNLVLLLGGLAAQGASAVFGPADMCFNAAQFLMDIPKKISKFYDDLAQLFEEIYTSMKQFHIYERMDQYALVGSELKQCTHKLMILFVDTCALSMKVLGGSKLKHLAKIALFDDDSGINAKLEEFRRLVRHQGQISNAITLEHVLKSESEQSELKGSVRSVLELLRTSADSAQQLDRKFMELQDELNDQHGDVKIVKADTEVLVKDVKDRSSMKKQQEQYDQICKSLFPGNMDLVKKSERDLEHMRSGRLAMTGSWLAGLEDYNRWIDFESGTSSILLLTGDTGSGKSRLAYAILDRMKSLYHSAGSSKRVSWASYRFERNDKSLPGSTAITDSLKSLAVQIAKQDAVYSKDLCLYLDTRDVPSSTQGSNRELVKALLPSPMMTDVSDIGYVLLFDDINQLPPADANQLVAALLAVEYPRTRIVVTGTEEYIRSTLHSNGKNLDESPNIRVPEHNEADIRRFIDREVEECELLQDESPAILKIVESIRDRTPNIVKGNFNDVKQIIERVSEAVKTDQPEEEIDKLISVETLEDAGAAAARLVTELNELLNKQEIEQLNELLAWTIYAWGDISVDEMRAALFLRTQRAPLQSLEDKVAHKYSRILQIGSGNNKKFEINNPYLKDFFEY